jgi:sec-independent protein translocase protein TatC
MADLPTPVPEELDESRMSMLEHLTELRRRLLWALVAFILAFFICFHFAASIYGFLMHPLAAALEGENRRMIYTGLTEAFFTYLKVGVWAAFFIAFPILAAQIWKFVAPGLYKNERRAFLPFLLATPVLFFLGAGLLYYGVMPLLVKFFIGFESAGGPGQLPIQLEARVSEYLGLIMQLILAFGVCFQLPVLLTLLVRAGLLKTQTLSEKRRYAVVGIFIVAAVVTPPDVISQLMLALPLMALYEVSILACRWVEKKSPSV